MGIVNDAVEDRVGQGGIPDQGMRAVHRDLAGDQGGATAVAVFDDFEHIVALLGTERFDSTIVEAPCNALTGSLVDPKYTDFQSREVLIPGNLRGCDLCGKNLQRCSSG